MKTDNFFANFDVMHAFFIFTIQSTPDNSNLQGKSKTVRVIGSLKKITGSKKKNSFYSTVNILITFNCRNVKLKLKDTSGLSSRK